MLKHLCCIVVSTVSSAFGLAAETPGLNAEVNPDGITVTESGRSLLHYQLKTKSQEGDWPRANYIHPLHDLDGNVITEDFPHDHGHHRGIFWAWHQVWVGDQKVGDSWVCREFLWDVQSQGVEHCADGSLRLIANVEWKSSQLADDTGEMIPIVAERTVVTVHPANDQYRLLDFEISLKALLQNVRIGGSEDVKGYGGFSPRIKLSKDQKFVGHHGEVEPQKTAVEAGSWIDISNGNQGVAILSHPSNPGYPEPWILRAKRSMQNAQYPGAEPVELSMTTPTVLRYRLVLHRGSAEQINIPGLSADFASNGKR
ncbi:MAG: PmoA family protein [Fuerstiella sp.]|nr:PmoA family protein [Fuerstiella sp.]